MSAVAEQIVAGLAAGGVYALLALAVVVGRRASGVVNVAQGELATASALGCAALVAHGWAFWPAFGVTVVLSFAGGALLHATLVRPLQHGSLLALLALTAGLLLAVNGLDAWIWGGARRPFAGAFSAGEIGVGGLSLARRDLGVLALSLAACALAGLVLARSRFGLGLRAAGTNPLAARYAGIHVGRVVAAGWGLAAALGAVAGVLAAPSFGLEPDMMRTALLYALAAAAVGRLESPLQAVAGGLGLGVAVELVRVHVHALDGGVPAAVGLGVLLVALTARRP